MVVTKNAATFMGKNFSTIQTVGKVFMETTVIDW